MDNLALRQRIECALAAAKIVALRQNEDKIAVQRLAGMSASFPSQTGAGREPVLIGSSSGTSFYPALLRPIPANSHPAIVLSKSQPKIKEVDEEIHRAQEALRRLIESNKQSEEDRMEWTKESAEATIDAENLSVSLVIDLVGARIDGLSDINGREREEVINHLTSRSDQDGQFNSIHVAYKMLVERKDQLERTGSMVRKLSKEYDKTIKLKDLIANHDVQTQLEKDWDALSHFEQWDKLAGPSKDLIYAVATIYRQAASLENLAVILGNQERSLQAAEVLHRYIVGLVALKQASKAQCSR